jgi:hypothetical protein
MLSLFAEESAPNPSTGIDWPTNMWQWSHDWFVNLTAERLVMMALVLLAVFLYVRGRLLERKVLRLAAERTRKDDYQTTTPSSPSSGLTFYQIESLLDKVLAAMQTNQSNAMAIVQDVCRAHSQPTQQAPPEDTNGHPHQAA